MKIKKIINVLSIGVIIGALVASVISIYYVTANRYIQYRMFRLIIFDLQKNLNSSIFYFVIGLLTLYILWFLFTEKMKYDKSKLIIQFIVIAIGILVLAFFIDLWLKKFSIYTLSTLSRKIFTKLQSTLTGKASFNYFPNLLRSYISNLLAKKAIKEFTYFIILIGVIILIPLLFKLFRRLILNKIPHKLLTEKLEKMSKIIEARYIRYIRKSALILIIFVVIFNLCIFADSKIHIPKRPNIILIYFDALRPDHLGSYGYNRDTSPNVDYLARSGVLFKNVFSQSSSTYPSVHSALTSRYGCYFFRTGKCALEKKYLTLAEVLKNNGYYTIAFSSSPVVTKAQTHDSLGGFDQGFDVFDDSIWNSEEYNWQWRSPEGIIKKALGWLNNNHGKKFFLFLFISDPHDKYSSPEPYHSLYDPGYVGCEDIMNGIIYKNALMAIHGGDTGLTNREIEHVMALYDGEIRYADAQIGILLERLCQLNLIDDTLIVLLSDHGSEFFEHEGLKHSYTLYNEVIKIPLILRYPALIPKGTVIEKEIIQTMDMAPTILDIVNINKPETMRGESLLPLIKKRDVNWRDFAISEAAFVDAKTIVTKKWKYIHHFESNLCDPTLNDRYKKGKELFDLEKDPKEKINLYYQKPEIAEKLYLKLMDLIPSFERERVTERKDIEYDHATNECLRSLGYLQ